MEFPYKPDLPTDVWDVFERFGIYEQSVLYRLNEGLPYIGDRAASNTAPSFTRNDEYPGNVKHLELPCLNDLKFVQNLSPKTLLKASRMINQLTWNSEDDIKRMVQNVIFDCLVLIEKIDEINLRSEMTIDSYRPDILVIRLCGDGLEKVIGFIEVKTPSDTSNIHESPKIFKQIADYAQMLCTTYGASWSVGILSTYNTWQVFRYTPGSVNHNSSNYNGDSDDVDDPSFSQSVLERSPIINWNGTVVDNLITNSKQNVHAIIIWALKKMLEMSHDGQKGLYPFITNKSRTWKKLDLLGPEPVSIDRRIKTFYLINELGRGAEGRVWRVAGGSEYKQYALKLYSKQKNQSATHEALLWNDIWEINSHVVEFFDRIGVVMPICHQVSDDEILQNKNVIVQLIGKIADKGYIHTDLVKRHVARLVDRIIFLDMSSCRQLSTTTEHATEQMCAQLFGEGASSP